MRRASSGTILVTGATGRLGSQVVRALRGRGRAVRALVRPGSEYFWLNDTGCSYHFGDLCDEQGLVRACRGVEAVAVCSELPWRSRRGHALLWSVARTRGVGRAILVSALGVERGYQHRWYESKERDEASLVRAGLEWTVLRPAPLTRTFAEVARRAVERGWGWLPGRGDNRVAPLAIADLAQLVVVALDQPGWGRQVVEVGGPQVLGARQVVEAAVTALGAEVDLRSLPGRSVLAGHRRRWFQDDFVAPAHPLVRASGVRFCPVAEAVHLDLVEMLPREHPDARHRLVASRRVVPDGYTPGEAELAAFADGPRRYDG